MLTAADNFLQKQQKQRERRCERVHCGMTAERGYRLVRPASAESVRPREAGRHEAADAAARAEPWTEIGFGAGTTLALAPGEAIGQAEHLAVGEPARFVALQDDAAAARHQRDVVELDDQHLPVVADTGNGVAVFRSYAHARASTLARGQYLLASAGLRHRFLAVDDKTAPIARGNEQLHAWPIGKQLNHVVVVRQIDHQPERLAMSTL